MKTTTDYSPFITVHVHHADYAKPIDQCESCNELMAKQEEATEAMVDQAIENKHHSHSDRR